MTRLIFLIISFIGFIGNAAGQNPINKVYKKFIAADSVILVSHLLTYLPIAYDSAHKKCDSYQLVKKNKVTYKIVKEKYRLDTKETDSIAKIIITPNKESVIKDDECFMPHHGILIFKKGRCSYFDICFGCRHFVTSKDIKLPDELSNQTWNDLEIFFKDRNLNYEMPRTESKTEDTN